MSSNEILEYLVKTAEETGLGINITLCVNGLIISGNIIRSKRYYDMMIQIYGGGKPTTNDPSEIEILDKHREDYKKFMNESQRRYNEQQTNHKYIYLDKVNMYPSDISKPIPAFIWCGKLSSIDGFSIVQQRSVKSTKFRFRYWLSIKRKHNDK